MKNSLRLKLILAAITVTLLLTTACGIFDNDVTSDVEIVAGEFQQHTVVDLLNVAEYFAEFTVTGNVAELTIAADGRGNSPKTLEVVNGKAIAENLYVDAFATRLLVTARDASGKELASITLSLENNEDKLTTQSENDWDGIYVKDNDVWKFYSLDYLAGMEDFDEVLALLAALRDEGVESFVFLRGLYTSWSNFEGDEGWDGDHEVDPFPLEGEEVFDMESGEILVPKDGKLTPPQRLIVEVEELDPLGEVYLGTPFADLLLPDQVEVTLDNDEKVDVDVDWNEDDYDADTPGDYTIYGELVNLPENVNNDDELTAQIDVTVKEEQVTLTIVHTGTGVGTTDPAEGTHEYDINTLVEFTAYPEHSYFIHWKIDETGYTNENNPYSRVISDDKLVEAKFELKTYDVQFEDPVDTEQQDGPVTFTAVVTYDGDPVEGLEVDFSIVAGADDGTELADTTATTDEDGKASVELNLADDQSAGEIEVKVDAPNFAAATAKVFIVPVPGGVEIIKPETKDNLVAGEAFYIDLKLIDKAGNGMAAEGVAVDSTFKNIAGDITYFADPVMVDFDADGMGQIGVATDDAEDIKLTTIKFDNLGSIKVELTALGFDDIVTGLNSGLDLMLRTFKYDKLTYTGPGAANQNTVRKYYDANEGHFPKGGTLELTATLDIPTLDIPTFAPEHVSDGEVIEFEIMSDVASGTKLTGADADGVAVVPVTNTTATVELQVDENEDAAEIIVEARWRDQAVAEETIINMGDLTVDGVVDLETLAGANLEFDALAELAEGPAAVNITIEWYHQTGCEIPGDDWQFGGWWTWSYQTDLDFDGPQEIALVNFRTNCSGGGHPTTPTADVLHSVKVESHGLVLMEVINLNPKLKIEANPSTLEQGETSAITVSLSNVFEQNKNELIDEEINVDLALQDATALTDLDDLALTLSGGTASTILNIGQDQVEDVTVEASADVAGAVLTDDVVVTVGQILDSIEITTPQEWAHLNGTEKIVVEGMNKFGFPYVDATVNATITFVDTSDPVTTYQGAETTITFDNDGVGETADDIADLLDGFDEKPVAADINEITVQIVPSATVAAGVNDHRDNLNVPIELILDAPEYVLQGDIYEIVATLQVEDGQPIVGEEIEFALTGDERIATKLTALAGVTDDQGKVSVTLEVALDEPVAADKLTITANWREGAVEAIETKQEDIDVKQAVSAIEILQPVKWQKLVGQFDLEIKITDLVFQPPTGVDVDVTITYEDGEVKTETINILFTDGIGELEVDENGENIKAITVAIADLDDTVTNLNPDVNLTLAADKDEVDQGGEIEFTATLEIDGELIEGQDIVFTLVGDAVFNPAKEAVVETGADGKALVTVNVDDAAVAGEKVTVDAKWVSPADNEEYASDPEVIEIDILPVFAELDIVQPAEKDQLTVEFDLELQAKDKAGVNYDFSGPVDVEVTFKNLEKGLEDTFILAGKVFVDGNLEIWVHNHNTDAIITLATDSPEFADVADIQEIVVEVKGIVGEVKNLNPLLPVAVTFEVKDALDVDLEGATVTIFADGDEVDSKDTGVNGEVVFAELEQGSYTYLVEKAGYLDREGTFVADDDKTVAVTLHADEVDAEVSVLITDKTEYTYGEWITLTLTLKNTQGDLLEDSFDGTYAATVNVGVDQYSRTLEFINGVAQKQFATARTAGEDIEVSVDVMGETFTAEDKITINPGAPAVLEAQQDGLIVPGAEKAFFTLVVTDGFNVVDTYTKTTDVEVSVVEVAALNIVGFDGIVSLEFVEGVFAGQIDLSEITAGLYDGDTVNFEILENGLTDSVEIVAPKDGGFVLEITGGEIPDFRR